ncbi:MAG: S46 family peptidase [Bacteroidales bacterium]|nr:S46 family peptidase [Bacteroidales bacterium]
MNKLIKSTGIIMLAIMFIVPKAWADEGMWIPMLLKKYNIEDMQAKGFKLTAEDIYSINQSSLKDAIVIFGGGCTGEIISKDGLLITNHHCGYGQIQRHSTVENDYLTDGFWAMSRDEELPNPGLRVTFLVRMDDVTSKILEGVENHMEMAERQSIISGNLRKVQKEAIEGTHYKARVAPFFSGNQYFLFLYEDYLDVRLVGAPPSAIGKFGGETDNWMWPRHTGDFSLFRIYSGKDNQPAAYSEDNIPYTPKKHLPISLKGIEKGDFTMVFGYPGRTSEYVPSFVIEDQVKNTIPTSIDLRTKRLDIILAAMETSPKIRIQYSAKKSGIANGWKKNQGVLKGLQRLDAVNKKKQFEVEFEKWANNSSLRSMQYVGLLDEYRQIIEDRSPFALANTFANDAGRAAEIIAFASRFEMLGRALAEKVDQESLDEILVRLESSINRHFKDYHAPTDRKLMASLYKAWLIGAEKEFVPSLLLEVDEEYDGDIESYAADLFKNSLFADKDRLNSFLLKLKSSDSRKILQDQAFLMSKSLSELKSEVISPGLSQGQKRIAELQRLYMKAQMEMQSDKVFYPDANFTLRVTYGKIDSFEPKDGVSYKYFTTLKGIVEKDNPDIYDYRVPGRLKELYYAKDFGAYGFDGQMPVCFTASNHTSGGNSGSPVVNAEGHLIGINFDRNWEGTMSDMMYDPSMCRNISIDIRYALFIIDKFAGATHLIKEMDLIR